ncbi:hypothetical protein [Paenibacillus sp. FSL H8-0034]
MSKTTQQQEGQIGGFDETYLDELDPEAPDFVERFIEAVKRPIKIENEEK